MSELVLKVGLRLGCGWKGGGGWWEGREGGRKREDRGTELANRNASRSGRTRRVAVVVFVVFWVCTVRDKEASRMGGVRLVERWEKEGRKGFVKKVISIVSC